MIDCKEAIDYFSDVKKIKLFKLLKQKWEVLKEMDKVLRFPYQATIELQIQSLTLSDVFGIWLKMRLGLAALISSKKNMKTNLAKHLMTALDNRKDVIFSNPFMSSALFLDPRFRSQIRRDESKMEEAKMTLKNVWRRLKVIESLSAIDTNANNSHTSTVSDASFEYNAEEELEKFLTGNSRNQSNEQMQVEEDIDMLLETFDPPHISSKMDILEYWDKEKDDNNVLYRLAMVIFSIPPTEVQIERDFSKLNFVFSSRRCNLAEERLNDIMVINLNSDLFHIVKNEELMELIHAKKLKF